MSEREEAKIREQDLKKRFELYLDEQLEAQPASRLSQAMRYSLMAPGKRIRPRLLFAGLEAYGLPPETGFPAAAAIEMIHTYSLIHDDMPEMDNDDMRRGRLTCHRRFGADTALLAGDALQSLAFETLAKTVDPTKIPALLALSAEMAGPKGMCYGQDLDLQAKGNTTLQELETIEAYKTGCLLALPLASAAILAGHEEDAETWREIGRLLGIQFQIQDDILEKTSSPEIMGKSLSDARNDKATALSLFGLEEARSKVFEYGAAITNLLETLSLEDQSLRELIEAMQYRTR